MGERPARVKSERGYDGEYIFQEIRFQLQRRSSSKGTKIQDAQAVVRKSWQKIPLHKASTSLLRDRTSLPTRSNASVGVRPSMPVPVGLPPPAA